MRQLRFIFLLLTVFGELTGQSLTENVPGKVSFISSQNIYVKFKSTAGISTGDTLFVSAGNTLIPVMTVKNLSSVSCVCTAISEANLQVDKIIIAKAKIITPQAEKTAVAVKPQENQVKKVLSDSLKKDEVKNELKQRIKGSLSASSYSDFSNTSASNSNRFRYTLSLDARNIADSKFSVDSYISFKHKAGDWGEVKSNLFSALKIYNLSVRYDVNKTTQISLGRKINSRISNIGAMDGLQFEKSINNFSMGAIAGTRPDYTDYGFDSKLLQYGAYVGYSSKKTGITNESSLAFMQQTNNSKTDRRFIYLQHSNSIVKNLYFFSTFEVDLYKLTSDSLPQNTFNPTGMYLSLRYKITKNISLSGSYDARKNIMYYETYKTYIDRILETELRQGFRFQVNYRITKDIMVGVQSGYRFLKSDPHPSKNAYGYLTYSRIPGVNISATLSATLLESNYMNGKILGLSISRELFKGKLSTDIGYRYVDYRLPENLLNIRQSIAEMNLSWQIFKNLSLSMNYEGTFEKLDKYNRIYLQVRKRF
jgi:hypothetical protein